MIKIKRYVDGRNDDELKHELLTYLFEIDSNITYPVVKDTAITLDMCMGIKFTAIKTASWFLDAHNRYWIVQADDEHEMFLALKYPHSTIEIIKAWDIR